MTEEQKTEWIEERFVETVKTFEGVVTFLQIRHHTKRCAIARSRMEFKRNEFARRYPNYCRKCGGAGGFMWHYDPSPAGVSLAGGYMVDAEPCPECVEQGKCPKCGHQHEITDPVNPPFSDEDFACESCGYVPLQDDPPPTAQPDYECHCWDRKDYPGSKSVKLISMPFEDETDE